MKKGPFKMKGFSGFKNSPINHRLYDVPGAKAHNEPWKKNHPHNGKSEDEGSGKAKISIIRPGGIVIPAEEVTKKTKAQGNTLNQVNY